MTGSPLSTLASILLLSASPAPAAADTGAISETTEVTGTRGHIDPDRSPLPSSVLEREPLRREHTVSIARAIESLPGARTLSTGGQVGTPVLGGLFGPRVLVLDDGYRLEDYSWSDEDGASIDARLPDRVDVIRGPASVLYGSDAIGGVVNAVPADLPDARGRQPFARTGLEAYGATNNAEFGGALRLDGASGALGGRLNVVGRGGSDLRTPDGKIPNTGFDALNGEAALGVRGADGRATLRYARHGGEYELQEAAGPEPGQQDGPRRRLGDNRVQLGGDLLLGGLRFECKAQWQNHSMIEIAREPVGAGTPGIEAEQFHLVLDTYAVDLLAHHTAGPLRGTLGGSGLAQTNDTQGPIPVVPDARMHSGAAFAFEELEHGRWSFVAGARVDRRHLETDADAILGLPADSREDLEASADGGVLYRLSDALALNANAGRGWRAPSLFELYANGPHLGEARYELGNPDLEPERSFEADAGVRVRRPHLKLDLSGFVNRIDRYIEAAPIGETRVVGADTLSVYEYTQADARLTGGALWAEIEAAAPLTLRAQADYVSGQNLALDRPLSWVPPLRAALGVECHRENLGWAERGTLGLEIEHVSEQTRLGPFDTATDPYTLLHLEAGMGRRFGSRTFQLDLRVRNLADRTYRSFLSRYKGFAPDPGRNVVLRLSTAL